MAGIVWGCQSSTRDVLTVEAGSYEQAFAAVRTVARREGMPAAFADPRAGVIETQPRIAGSILEPWRTDNASLAMAMENTVALQRRRARFEFVPMGVNSQAADQPSASTTPYSQNPDLLAINQPLPNLMESTQPLELRVWVYVERNETPGIRRSTWTRRHTTHMEMADPTHPDADEERWAVMSQDAGYAARLLEKVQEEMARSAKEQAAAAGEASAK